MAMVEMVIILPLLLMVLFAIAEFGLAFTKWQTLTNAAREGARDAVMFRVDCDAGTVVTEVQNTVISYANAGGVTVAPGDITVTGACGAVNTDTSVSVDYTVQDFFKVLPGFASSVNPDLTLSASATMRNEGNS
jgi:Flp pilus assembly protein TadG